VENCCDHLLAMSTIEVWMKKQGRGGWRRDLIWLETFLPRCGNRHEDSECSLNF
jgi:hypothetical protein